MIQVERILMDYSFETDRIESLQIKRKIALLASACRFLFSFLIYAVFVSLFVSIFRLFMEVESGFVYIIMAFMALVLIFILYTNFKEHFVNKVSRIFPGLTLTGFSGTVISVISILLVLASALLISISVFPVTDFNKNGFSFIVRWVISILGIVGIVGISALFNIPVLKYEVVYFEKISKWIIGKIDAKSEFHTRHRWPSMASLFSSGDKTEREAHPGINMLDVDKAFAGYLHQFLSASFDDSVSIKTGKHQIDIAQLELKTKEVKQSHGKKTISIQSVFKGTVIATSLKSDDSIARVSTKFHVPLFMGEIINKETTTNGETNLELAGNDSYPKRFELEKTCVFIHDLWNSDTTVLVSQGRLFLLLYDTNLFTEMALSADLFTDEHVRKPLETLHEFAKLAEKLNL